VAAWVCWVAAYPCCQHSHPWQRIEQQHLGWQGRRRHAEAVLHLWRLRPWAAQQMHCCWRPGLRRAQHSAVTGTARQPYTTSAAAHARSSRSRPLRLPCGAEGLRQRAMHASLQGVLLNVLANGSPGAFQHDLVAAMWAGTPLHLGVLAGCDGPGDVAAAVHLASRRNPSVSFRVWDRADVPLLITAARRATA